MIYRQIRPVYWSPSSGTALAEAELEYHDDHRSLALYAKFPLVNLGTIIFFYALTIGKLKELVSESEQVFAAIWTTTPWTIPANRVNTTKAILTDDVGHCI
jgi:isoleucyl-tRNA synthetase